MKATDTFKKVIEGYLEMTASKDKLFAETLKKENKNIDDCITYIMNTVQKSGRNGFADDEIFNMAIHYYDEDDIVVGKSISANVVVNHSIPKPTPSKVAEVQKKATPKAKDEDSLFTQPTTKQNPGQRVQQTYVQTSLF